MGGKQASISVSTLNASWLHFPSKGLRLPDYIEKAKSRDMWFVRNAYAYNSKTKKTTINTAKYTQKGSITTTSPL